MESTVNAGGICVNVIDSQSHQQLPDSVEVPIGRELKLTARGGNGIKQFDRSNTASYKRLTVPTLGENGCDGEDGEDGEQGDDGTDATEAVDATVRVNLSSCHSAR